MRTVKELAMKCIVAAMNGIYCVLKLLPVQKKAVFISRQTDKTPVDFRLIIEELDSRKCGWKTVVLAKRLRKSAAGIVGYGFHTLRQMYHIATARVVLVDGYCIPVSVLRHKECIKIIQIWHAIGCMKKFGYAMIGEEEGSSEDVARIMKMHRNYDYALISSYSFVQDYLEGFRIEREKILQIPLPKADLLTSEEYLRNQRDKLTGKYHVLAEKRNILYCPTFRKDETAAEEGIRRLVDGIDFSRYNLIYNPHPNSRAKVNDSRVLILPYSTMELLAVADYVISDYSSVIYEAGLAKKPVYLYGYDWKEYSRKRAFNLDLTKDVPTLFTDNPREILKAIDDDDFDCEGFSEFINKNVVIPEGGCASAIADLILGERKQIMKDVMRTILKERCSGKNSGIPSYCTANPQVLKAILVHAKETGNTVLIEATANQVNQFGGYTGMKPEDYKNYIFNMADEIGCKRENIILGGDHLGPLTWSDEPEKDAMAKAKELVRLFTLAGYTKIHLDTSMRLADDPSDRPLTDETIARRGVELYKVSIGAYKELREENPNALRPSYIIGSEVPIPGGSQEEEDSVVVTKPEALEHTLSAYRAEFKAQGVEDGINDVIAVVVQPGVEFGNDEVHIYDREEARSLCEACRKHPEIMLEGHSTDYQPKEALKEMVEDGVGILKVGPQITFAFREALFALSHIEKALIGGDGLINGRKPVDFPAVMEKVMVDNPKDWVKHYHGDETSKKIDRKFSLSDRCRYYFSTDEVQDAIKRLYENIDGVSIPLGLLHQYMPHQYHKVLEGTLVPSGENLATDHVREVFYHYEYAVN